MALGDQQSPGPMGPCQGGTHVNSGSWKSQGEGWDCGQPIPGRESSACVLWGGDPGGPGWMEDINEHSIWCHPLQGADTALGWEEWAVSMVSTGSDFPIQETVKKEGLRSGS